MRKVCVVVASRANYGRVKPVLEAIKESDNLELQLIAGASVMLEKYGQAIDVIRSDGFSIDRSIYYIVEGENLLTQAKTTGLGIIELASAFEDLKPDIVVTVADRFETMATAIAASYMNIPLAHIQGGEITGNIDETVRHAITKLSHYHFPATEQSRERIIKMGEESWRVVNTGCPSIDTIVKQDLSIQGIADHLTAGVGSLIDINSPYVLMVQHPVTTSFGEGKMQIEATLEALNRIPEQKVVLWPNSDAGSDLVSKGIRNFREKNSNINFRIFKNFPPDVYNVLLANCACAVGNSSSFIREGSYLGVPAVQIGDRQNGREHSNNVVFTNYDSTEIYRAVSDQIKHGSYSSSALFGSGKAGKLIADYLAIVEVNINKRMTY